MKIQDTTAADLVRCITRPLLTVLALAAWVFFIASSTDYPQSFQWLTTAMCLEWFTERAIARFRQPKAEVPDKAGKGAAQ